MNKGQLQISFHFIFAVIGGFLFLAFFFILIKSIIYDDEKGDQRDLSFAVETIAKNAIATPNTYSIFQLYDRKYNFVCEHDAGGISSYVRIGDSSYEQDSLRHIPFFSPGLIEGNEIYSLTKTWSVPFPAGSLLYLSNNRTRYVLVAQTNSPDSSQTLAAIDKFVEDQNLAGFGFEVISVLDLEDYEDKGFAQYRFVFFSNSLNAFISAVDSSWRQEFKDKSTVLVVTPTKLRFYDDVTVTNVNEYNLEVDYYGEAMILAGIFAGTSELFECNMEKALERLASSALILRTRIAKITRPGIPLPHPDCRTFLVAAAQEELDQFYITARTMADFQAILTSNSPANLQTLNQRLNAKDCPMIY